MLLEYHRNMLADKVRNGAFFRALEKVIRKNHTIADLGSGTGFLAFVARKLGAKEVYLYEHADIINLSRKIAKNNKINKIHFFQEYSTAFINPPSVDLIISETLGNYVFEEHIIQTIEDGKRFLNPGGIIIPHRIEQFVAPIVTDRFYKDFLVWDNVGYGLDYSAAKEMSLNNIYVRDFKPDDLLDNGKSAEKWDSLDFYKKNKSSRKGNVGWEIKKDVVIYGFAVWWSCELIEGIELSTSPFSPKTHWEQLYFPVLVPIKANKGDKLIFEISSQTSYEEGTIIKWNVSVQQSNGRTLKQSLDLRKGYLE